MSIVSLIGPDLNVLREEPRQQHACHLASTRRSDQLVGSTAAVNRSSQPKREKRTLHLDLWAIRLIFAEALMEQYRRYPESFDE